jgi:ribosomal protein S6
MSETKMPAAEAVLADEKEVVSYELAFHILPTVAEGEVPSVFENLKKQIVAIGGEVFDEEVPLRFDLAYEIVKYLEGKNRKFSSAYFGWVRFKLSPAVLAEFTESLDGSKEILRYLLVKLTRVEEETPFRFHESIADRKVRTIIADEPIDLVDEEVAEIAADEVIEEEVVAVAEADSKDEEAVV